MAGEYSAIIREGTSAQISGLGCHFSHLTKLKKPSVFRLVFGSEPFTVRQVVKVIPCVQFYSWWPSSVSR